MLEPLFNQLHPQWQKILREHRALIENIDHEISSQEIAPVRGDVFRSLSRSVDETRVVIFGQDPYPTAGNADGLAFSTRAKKTPSSLANIFKELSTDIGGEIRTTADLSDWFDQGVLLLNRVLSTKSGESLAHNKIGWQLITDHVAQELGKRDVVAVLWGASAGQLSKYFRSDWMIQSVHPSPLSSYRGFFGSQPFSKCNKILVANNLLPINW